MARLQLPQREDVVELARCAKIAAAFNLFSVFLFLYTSKGPYIVREGVLLLHTLHSAREEPTHLQSEVTLL